jgi:hypothetical protein
MATIKDFILKQGLQVNTSITVGGIDVLANDLATLTTARSEFAANDFATLNAASANDYNTYTTLQGEYRANDYNTYTTLVGLIDAVEANVGGGSASANANDFNTYTTLVSEYQANDYNTYTTLQGEFAANDFATLTAARANDYNTYTTLQGELAANDYNTYTTLQSEFAANDYNTYTTLQGEFAANDFATLTAARANDYNTYTTLQGEFAANDGVTLNSALANDGVTLLSARANDYNTYTTLVNEYNANDFATYTTLQSEYRANDFATWSGLSGAINIKANSAINIIAGDGITGGGDLTANVNIAVDSTVVRTSGDQSIAGIKTFSDNVIVVGDLTVEGNTTTIGTTSLLVSDKFIELAANTVGTPAGDVGLYLNRGDFGNSAIYYDQAGGYFALAETFDPSTNVQVSPVSFANLRIGALQVGSTDLVTNLNADRLDGQEGSYYLDFANASNTNYITLAYVTANGAITTDSISVGGLAVNTDTLYVDSANDRVGINTLVPGSSLQIKEVALETASLTTTTTTADQIVDSWSVSTYRTAKYLLQVHDTNSNEYHTSEILLTHNGTTVFLTEYAIIFTAASLATFNADISGGNVRLLVTPTNADNVVKAYRQLLTV